MPRATTGASAGVVRTRQKPAAAAATGPSSSSVESQHTTCGLTSNAPGSPESKHHNRRVSHVSKSSNKQQQSKRQHPGNALQAANSQKQQPDLAQSLQQPTAEQSQQQVAKERAASGKFNLRQGARTIQQQQQLQRAPQSDAGNRLLASFPTTRSGSRSATAAAAAATGASAPPTAQLECPQGISHCRTSLHPTAALVEAAEAADLVACLCNGMTSRDHSVAASWPETEQQQHLQSQQERRQQQQQQPACLKHQAQKNAPTAAAAAAAPRRRSRRLADLIKATLPTPPAAAAAVAVVHDDSADHSSSQLAAYPLPTRADAATAETNPNAIQGAQAAVAAARGEDVDTADVPPTSLQARFARLSAEQQLSILLELEQLTQLEEGCKAKQAARRAAVEAREKDKEAARQHKRRSGRLHQVMEGAGNTYLEGGASRSGTPETAHMSPLKPGAAAAQAPSSKRMRRFDGLWLPVTTPDCCNHAQVSSKCARTDEHRRRERGSPSPGPDALKNMSSEGDGESMQQQVPGRTDSPEPAAVSATSAGAAVLHTLEARQRSSSLTGHAVELNEQGSNNRPLLVRRLGARAQARKGSAARKRAWVLCTAPGESAVPASAPTSLVGPEVTIVARGVNRV